MKIRQCMLVQTVSCNNGRLSFLLGIRNSRLFSFKRGFISRRLFCRGVSKQIDRLHAGWFALAAS